MKPVRDLAASARDRLYNLGKQKGQPFGELLQNFANERFLYRLSRSPHRDLFVLKGALLFRVWGVSLRRATRDMDFRGHPEVTNQDIERVFREVCQHDVEADGRSTMQRALQASRS